MDYEIKKRVLTTAELFLRNRSTVREVAKMVDCSKSTVHKDLTERLPEINHKLYADVKELLEYNKSIRHLRGGEATRRRFLEAKQKGNE
ncbi:MAG TPA: stage III sporulation protein D [Acholeplasmataceae bacterium]|nr:stage III sporulation protein D [Acholeplasmataceae bacterium]